MSAHKRFLSPPRQRCSDFSVSDWESKAEQSVLFFHNSIHRNLLFTAIITLTILERLFSLSPVDG
jgi:hypothetical protein